jgi:hypothetical protein
MCQYLSKRARNYLRARLKAESRASFEAALRVLKTDFQKNLDTLGASIPDRVGIEDPFIWHNINYYVPTVLLVAPVGKCLWKLSSC